MMIETLVRIHSHTPPTLFITHSNFESISNNCFLPYAAWCVCVMYLHTKYGSIDTYPFVSVTCIHLQTFSHPLTPSLLSSPVLVSHHNATNLRDSNASEFNGSSNQIGIDSLSLSKSVKWHASRTFSLSPSSSLMECVDRLKCPR